MIANKKKPSHGKKVTPAMVKKGASAMSHAMTSKVGSTKKHQGQRNRIEKKI